MDSERKQESAEPPASSQDALDRSLLRGVAWTAGVKWASQALGWGSLIILARVLTPADYGIVGMAGLYLGLIAILTEGGLGTSIITLREMTSTEVAQLNTVAVALGSLGTVLTCAAAYPLGLYFKSPDLPWVVVGLSASSLFSALRIVPTALLQRDLRFRDRAMVEVAQTVIQTTANVGFALLGFRYWALVIGAAAGTLAASAIAIGFRPHRFAWPRRGALRRYVHFTRDVLVGRLAWYVYTNADFLVAGRMLGSAALGAYTFAWNIASVPVEKVTALITQVTPAYFSRLQRDNPGLRRLLLNVTEGLVYLTLPASFGMAFVARDFVQVFLGNQWSATVVPLQILALYASLRSVVTLLPQALTVKGDTRFLMWNGVRTAIALPIAFVIGSRWGGAGIAAMWVAVYPLFVLPLYRRCFRAIELPWTSYLAVVRPALRGSLAMALVLFGVRLVLPSGWPAVFRAGLLLLAGLVTFLAVAIVPRRARLQRIFQLLLRRPAAEEMASA